MNNDERTYNAADCTVEIPLDVAEAILELIEDHTYLGDIDISDMSKFGNAYDTLAENVQTELDYHDDDDEDEDEDSDGFGPRCDCEQCRAELMAEAPVPASEFKSWTDRVKDIAERNDLGPVYTPANDPNGALGERGEPGIPEERRPSTPVFGLGSRRTSPLMAMLGLAALLGGTPFGGLDSFLDASDSDDEDEAPMPDQATLWDTPAAIALTDGKSNPVA